MMEQIELRQDVEALAMKVVVDDLSSAAGFEQSLRGLAGAVSGIRDRAQTAGSPEVARIAAELCNTLGAGSAHGESLGAALQAGVTAMQQALESTSQPAEAAPDPAAYSLAQDPELLSDFVLESREHLSAIESRSLALEQEPGNAEALHSIFRAFHTIKGLAGFLELDAVREVSHEVETVLDLARNAKLSITPQVIDVVLESADYLKACVDGVDTRLRGQESPAAPDNTRLLNRIRNLMAARPDSEGAPDPEVTAEPHEPEAAGAVQSSGRPQTMSGEAKAVKVDTGKLDYLVDMAGELVIAQSMVRHDPDLAVVKSPRLQRNLAQLARITAELQKTSMSMRLVPIGQLFQRVARQVRDLSRKMGKPAELDISGEDTEIDRTIVEELADPLMHMVRNALDHGIEDPEARAEVGKNAVARIGLHACHQAGHIVIEISDDGRGLDPERILAKAMEKGLALNLELSI